METPPHPCTGLPRRCEGTIPAPALRHQLAMRLAAVHTPNIPGARVPAVVGKVSRAPGAAAPGTHCQRSGSCGISPIRVLSTQCTPASGSRVNIVFSRSI
jgi:hypothetical protein